MFPFRDFLSLAPTMAEELRHSIKRAWLTCTGIQLASSAFASQDDEAEDDDGGETTLYFDAEEGTFVNEDGEEIQVDIEEENEEEIEEEGDGEETAGEEGAADEEPPATGLNIGGHTIASRSTSALLCA